MFKSALSALVVCLTLTQADAAQGEIRSGDQGDRGALRSATNAPYGIFPRETLGCRDRGIVEQSARLQMAGDSNGFRDLMAEARRSGTCIVITGGTPARSIARDERFECVVLPDEGQCFWTPRGQLRP